MVGAGPGERFRDSGKGRHVAVAVDGGVIFNYAIVAVSQWWMEW